MTSASVTDLRSRICRRCVTVSTGFAELAVPIPANKPS